MPTTTEVTSGAEIAVGDPVSARDFVRLYPRLRAFARVIADADMDPNDLVHDALVAVLQSRTGPIENAEHYLRRTMLNRVRTLRRAAGNQRRHLHLVADGSTRAGVAPDYPSDVGALLEVLTPQERAVLYLLDVERMPVAEVGSLIGDSAVAIRSRASRARRKMRRHLEEEK
jgi:DNA-directed RNA polymerase specialized sigma24 family protein